MTTRFSCAVCLALGLLASSGCSGDGDTDLRSAAKADEPTPAKPTVKPAGVDVERGLRDQFPVDRKSLVNTGTGKYWSLEAGRRMAYRSAKGDTLAITVLHRTIEIDGVRCRVVEEREDAKGEIKEISLNYFAADPKTGDLYYFGEDVDIYDNGEVVAHDGSWRSGVKGARFGLAIPGSPKVGMKYAQEIAPGVAMDRAEVVSISGRQSGQWEVGSISGGHTAKSGRWDNCLVVRESTPLEKGTEEKWYAPGVGLLRDGDLELVGVFSE